MALDRGAAAAKKFEELFFADHRSPWLKFLKDRNGLEGRLLLDTS
jgi:hypothetical protein